MVELRQRITLKRKSPSPDSQKYNDALTAVPRRSSRKSGNEFDDSKTDQRVTAALDGDLLVISGLNAAKPRDPTASDADSQDVPTHTWENRWLGSPSKRRRIDRPINGNSQSPRPSPRGSGRGRRGGRGRGRGRGGGAARQLAAPARVRSDDEFPIARRGRLSDVAGSIMRRSRTNLSHAMLSKETSYSGTPIKSNENSAEPLEHGLRASKRMSQGQQDALDNLSSGRSTPVQVRSPAMSSIPSPGPPDRDDLAEQEPAVTKDPDELDSHDLPPAFLPMPPPSSPSQFQDVAAHMLSKLFPPISQPHRFTQALTSHPPSERKTETLLALAYNTQKALKAWQDEYLLLDKKTAPVALPIAKKPATGGRVPVDPSVFDAEKRKELYCEGSVLAAAMGIVFEPVGPKTHHHHTTTHDHPTSNGTGRELRRRKGEASVVDGLGISSDDAGGRGIAKRTRRPARRFEIGQNGQEGSDADVVVTRGASTRGRRGGGRWASRDTGRDHEQIGLPKRGRIGALLRAESAGASSMSATPESEYEQRKAPTRGNHYDSHVGPRGGRSAAARRRNRGNHANVAAAPAAATTGPRRQKAKSEKRSESMTLWWAARKKKAAEEKLRQMRERGEMHGPSEGIMDTSQPIVPQNTQKNAAAAAHAPASTPTSYGYPNPPASGPPAPGPPRREFSWHQHHHQQQQQHHHNAFVPPPRPSPVGYAQYPGSDPPSYSRPEPSSSGPSYTNSIQSILNNAPPPPSQLHQQQQQQQQRRDDINRTPVSLQRPLYGQHQYGPPGVMGQQPPLPQRLPQPPPPSYMQMQQQQQHPPPPQHPPPSYFQPPWGESRYPRY